MKAPFFTVLIDTYNYGEFIEEAVSSVLAQDFPAAQREILVVDDGSTDDTRQRLQKYKGEILYFTKAEWRALLREIQNWLQMHGANPNSSDMSAYLTQWVKSQERNGFALRRPVEVLPPSA